MRGEIAELYDKACIAKFLFMRGVIDREEFSGWYNQYEAEQHKQSIELAKKYNKKPSKINSIAFLRGAQLYTGSIVTGIKKLYPKIEYGSEKNMVMAVRLQIQNRNREISRETFELIEEIKRKENFKKKNKPLKLF